LLGARSLGAGSLHASPLSAGVQCATAGLDLPRRKGQAPAPSPARERQCLVGDDGLGCKCTDGSTGAGSLGAGSFGAGSLAAGSLAAGSLGAGSLRAGAQCTTAGPDLPRKKADASAPSPAVQSTVHMIDSLPVSPPLVPAVASITAAQLSAFESTQKKVDTPAPSPATQSTVHAIDSVAVSLPPAVVSVTAAQISQEAAQRASAARHDMHSAQLNGSDQAGDTDNVLGLERPPIQRRSATEKLRRHRISDGFKRLEKAIPPLWMHQKKHLSYPMSSRTDMASLLDAAVDFIRELE
ncbi:unnamed protein product, partial [Closterium sp. NIES-64]